MFHDKVKDYYWLIETMHNVTIDSHERNATRRATEFYTTGNEVIYVGDMLMSLLIEHWEAWEKCQR